MVRRVTEARNVRKKRRGKPRRRRTFIERIEKLGYNTAMAIDHIRDFQ